MDIKVKGEIVYDATPASELATKAQAALTGAMDIVIDSEFMFSVAADELKSVKALQKQVEAQRTTITTPLNAAVKAVNDLFRAPKEFLERAEAALKTPMLAWEAEQERLVIAARLQAERLAAAERQRLMVVQREQEQVQREAEQASREAAKAAEVAAAYGDIKLAQELSAQAADRSRAAESAMEDARATSMTAEVITFTPAVVATKVAGISGRVNYHAETPDLMALAKAVVAGLAPVQCLLVNEQFLGAQARATKQVGLLYGVVNIVSERGLSARAA